MIISTNKADTMLKRCLGKDKTIVIAIDKMIDQFNLDPTMTTPVRDAYIVTNEDISAKRLKDKFEQALVTKHPATKVIFINKASKPIYPNGLQGLDAVLQKPKPNDITQTISAVISTNSISEVVQKQVSANTEIPEYNPTQEIQEQTYDPMQDNFETPVEPEPEELVVEETPEPEPVPEPTPVEEDLGSTIVDRLKSTSTVGDISSLMREITASSLIKDLYDTNSTYAGIEEKLQSLNDVILNIMHDTNIKSLDEKLNKVRAVLHDKAFFKSKGDTLIEQRLEEVIETICEQTSALLQSRLSEIDAAIRRAAEYNEIDNASTRLASLTSEKSNLIIELRTLELEIDEIFKSTDRLNVGTTTEIARRSVEATDNVIVNEQLKARGSLVVSQDTIDAIEFAIELGTDKVPDVFKELKRKVITYNRLLGKVLECDQERIAALEAVQKQCMARNIEMTVTADTLLKKSLRVYVADESTGRTVIPYLISKYRSRQNSNVLLVDLTGTGKHSDYGIPYTDLDNFFIDIPQHDFTVAVGKLDNSTAAAQRLVTALLKAADAYRTINVVISLEQAELYRTIAQDVLSINFLVDTNNGHLNNMRKFIEEHGNIENVGKRIIVNKCQVPIHPIIKKLGLEDSIDYQICVIPDVPVLVDASLNSYNPYGISSVDLVMEDVLKHA